MKNNNNLPLCPVETTLTIIGNRWTSLIIRDLLTGTKRFGELKKSIDGISQKVLTQKLRNMEELGLVKRKIYPEVPPRVEYSLTEIGKSLQSVHKALRQWGEFYQDYIKNSS